MAERDRERDREIQRETERDRERQRETERDRDIERGRDRYLNIKTKPCMEHTHSQRQNISTCGRHKASVWQHYQNFQSSSFLGKLLRNVLNFADL